MPMLRSVVYGKANNYTVCPDHQTYGETCSCPERPSYLFLVHAILI
jgi:hypothetical protein